MAGRFELPAIVVIALLAFAIVHPAGDFPLDDDENHAIATWNFLHLHRFVFAIDTTPPLRAQVVWGALWARIFGESFNVLRASTMFLGIATLLLLNRLLLLGGLAFAARFVATLALLFNPIFFWATHTFMTETPFVFASVLALFCFFLAIRRESLGWFFAGCTAVAISWWIRQGIINIFPPIIVLAAFRGRVAKRWKPMLAIATGVLAAYAFMAIFRRDLIVASPGEFAEHYRFWSEETFRLPDIASFIFGEYFLNAQHAALFFLPLALGVAIALPAFTHPWERVVLAVLVAAFTWRATQMVYAHSIIPYYNFPNCCGASWGSIFMNFGLGPPTIGDVWSGVHPYPWTLPYAARLVLMYGSVILAALALTALVSEIVARLHAPRTNVLFLLASCSVVVGTATLIVSGQYVDRYSLDTAWAAVVLLAMIIRWDVGRVRLAAIATLAIFAIFCVFATQEYFAWNRARWAAFGELRARGVPINEIDGGAEPYLYYELSHAKTMSERRRMGFGAGKRPYVIAFAPLPQTRVIARHPFTGWLGLHRAELVTLARD